MANELNGKTPDPPTVEQFILGDSDSGLEKPLRELTDAELNDYHGKLNFNLAQLRPQVLDQLKQGLDRVELLVEFIGVIDFERERRQKASRIVTGAVVAETVRRVTRGKR